MAIWQRYSLGAGLIAGVVSLVQVNISVCQSYIIKIILQLLVGPCVVFTATVEE